MSSDEDEEQLEVSEDDDDVSEDDDDFPEPEVDAPRAETEAEAHLRHVLEQESLPGVEECSSNDKEAGCSQTKDWLLCRPLGAAREKPKFRWLIHCHYLVPQLQAFFFAHYENTTATRFTQSITHGKRLDAVPGPKGAGLPPVIVNQLALAYVHLIVPAASADPRASSAA